MEQSRSYIAGGRTAPDSEADPGARRSVARLALPAVLAIVLTCGCGPEPKDAMANAYYLSPNKDLRRLGRVALVELDSESNSPEIAANITDALFVEVQKRQVFGLTVVRRNDPLWQNLLEDLDSLQALRQLATVRESLGCNGVLVGTVTRYQPYPHVVIGLRLKMLDLTDGQLLWGMEQVWDGSDRSIQKRIKAFLKEQRQSGQSPLREELVVASPLNFCKFVAYEVAGTLERGRKR